VYIIFPLYSPFYNLSLYAPLPTVTLKNKFSQTQWLIAVKPATGEVKMGRILVRGQPRQKVHNIPSQVIKNCHLSYTGGGSQFRSAQA
jgi:hypothetical protein